MKRNQLILLFVLLMLAGAGGAFAATLDMTLSPATMTFSYQIGGGIPASQTLAIKSTGVALAYTLVVTQPASCSAPCLSVASTFGTTPGSIAVYANPTGLAAGTYSASIAVNAPGAATPNQTVAVTIVVANAASALSASSSSLAFTYTTGNPTTTQSLPITLSTNGTPLTATVTVAGGSWLKATPTGSVAMLGLPETLTVTTNALGLAPSLTPYKGTVTVASSNASNKSVVINVTLTVNAGIPTIAASNGIWPPGAPAGSANPVTVTITGTNFAATSIATSGATSLSNVTVISSTEMLATIPVSLLATAGSLPIVITTPSAAAPSAAGNFTVYNPAVPQVWAVANSGSYNQGVVSPGEIITIYGAGMGPAGVTPFSGASLPTSLGVGGANTSVTIDGVAAPLLYTSATQVSCVVPLAVAPGSASGPQVNVLVTYNGVTAATPLKVNVAASDPGIFTISSAGQAAVLNINTSVVPNDYSVNGSKNPAPVGSWIAIYATGFGTTSCVAAVGSPCDSPAPTAAQFVGGGTVTPTGALAVTIGGQTVTAPVGVVPVGSTIGLLQINAQIPATVKAGSAVPVTFSIAGVSSTGTATISVK